MDTSHFIPEKIRNIGIIARIDGGSGAQLRLP